jgi:hypothetical protein
MHPSNILPNRIRVLVCNPGADAITRMPYTW